MIQSGRISQMPAEMGIDSINAVKADNCCGERFLVLNICDKVTANKIQAAGSGSIPPLFRYGGSVDGV